MVYKNLVPGQVQFGNIIVGKGTNVIIEEIKFNADDIQNQDHQVAMADTVTFGQDQIKPTTIELTMHHLNNYMLPGWEHLKPNFWHSMPTVDDIVKEWRFDSGRKVWGQMMEIYLCNNAGEGKSIFGRPRSLQREKPPVGALDTTLIAEFQKADSLFYSPGEWYTELTVGNDPSYIQRTTGDADSWFRIWMEGPITNPRITIGECDIKLDYTIAENEIVEISSYPWMRRIVNNSRAFLASKYNGNTPLDKLVMSVGEPVPVRWTSDNYNTWSPALGNESWNEDIDSNRFSGLGEWKAPSTFTHKAGYTVVRLDIWNPDGPRKYLASGLFGTTSSVIYNKSKFNTSTQYAQARIVEPFYGKSAMCIMCNDAMTDGIALVVVSGGTNKLEIRRVTSPTTVGPVLATYTKPGGWSETDTVSIEYRPDIKTYVGGLNGDDKLSWNDSDVTVPVDNTRRSQGFIFDLDGNLTTQGVGFRQIIAYDKALVPTPLGKVFLFWRDAWVNL